MESFGRYLRNEREQRNISIQEVSAATKISPGQIKAMEEDELAALPTLTYVKGFIKAYSKCIGINPDESVFRFENYLHQIEQEEGSAAEEPIVGFRKEPPKAGMVFAAIGVIVLTLVILIVLIRACAGDSESRRRGYPPISAQFDSGQLLPHIPDVGVVTDDTSARITPTIPTVPPDSFKVRRTGPPPAVVVVGEEADASPGGGVATQK